MSHICGMAVVNPYQHDLYVAYFEHQAENHPSLAHDLANSDAVFQVIDVEESFADFKTGVKEKDYIMRLFNYTYRLGKESGQYMKMLEGGFLIAKHISTRHSTPAQIIAARAAAEKVCDDIIQRMLQDSEAGHILFNYSLNDGDTISVTPTGLLGDGSYIGWRVIFSFENFFTNCPENNVISTAFGGLTPNDLLP